MTLEGLKLDNVGVVEVVTATLQLSCSRCSSSTTVVLTAQGGRRVAGAAGSSGSGGQGVPGAVSDGSAAPAATAAPAALAAGGSSSNRAFEWAGSCSTCRQELGVLLRPRFVHEGSNVLAGLKTVGCSPLDLLPSVYGATCADCDAVGALRSLQVCGGVCAGGRAAVCCWGRQAGRQAAFGMLLVCLIGSSLASTAAQANCAVCRAASAHVLLPSADPQTCRVLLWSRCCLCVVCVGGCACKPQLWPLSPHIGCQHSCSRLYPPGTTHR